MKSLISCWVGIGFMDEAAAGNSLIAHKSNLT